MKNKWNNINELIRHIYDDDMLDSISKDLKCLTYAPNIGYCIWIFKYKDILVGLADMSNGHYDFYSAVTYTDLLMAYICSFVEKAGYFMRKSRNNHSLL